MNPQAAPEEKGAQQTGGSENETTVISVEERAKALDKKHRMISKVTDDKKLLKAQESINNMIDDIDARIDELKKEGKDNQSDTHRLKRLYAEVVALKNTKERKNGLEDKLNKIDKSLNHLTKEQSLFFDVPWEGEKQKKPESD